MLIRIFGTDPLPFITKSQDIIISIFVIYDAVMLMRMRAEGGRKRTHKEDREIIPDACRSRGFRTVRCLCSLQKRPARIQIDVLLNSAVNML